MQRVIYVGGPNICFNAACRRTEVDLNAARRQPPGPLKHSTLLASVGILTEEKIHSQKAEAVFHAQSIGSHFPLSYSSQGHMSSAHCAAGGPDSAACLR